MALKDEVGNKKVEILNQQFSNLNHRLESLEETKSTDALILSAVLLIKENALYNKNFAAEADILAQLAQGQDNITSAVQTIVSLKSLPIASNDELIKIISKLPKNSPLPFPTNNSKKTKKQTIMP